MPEKNESLVGKVCVCSVGRVGVVTHHSNLFVERENATIPMWHGVGLDGFGTWASSKPAVVAEDLKEFHDRLMDRFDGRMSRNR